MLTPKGEKEKTMLYKQIILIGLIGILSISPASARRYKTWDKMSQAEKTAYMLRKGRAEVSDAVNKFYEEDMTTHLKNMHEKLETIVGDTRGSSNKAEQVCLTFASANHQTRSGEAFLAQAFFNPENGHLLRVVTGNGHTAYYVVRGTLQVDVDEKDVANFTADLKDLSDSPYRELVEQSIEAIRLFGPDYLQTDCRYNVSLNAYQFDGAFDAVSQLNGKPYYAVMFFCDQGEHRLKMPFTAHVAIWEDTGKIWKITFGNGESITFLHRSYDEVKHDKDRRIVPWEEWNIQ